MATILLTKLKCIRPSDGGGADDVYVNFFVDGVKVGRWPEHGDIAMDKWDSEQFINRSFSFRKDLKVELWEHDPTSPDDYMGAYIFSATDSGSGNITLSDLKEGNIYQLGYNYMPVRGKIVRLHSTKCIAMSESVNSDLVNKAAALSGAVAEAAGKVLGNTPKPQAQLVGQALEAGATVLKQIPDLVDAIGRAGNYPDQIYMTFSDQSGLQNRIWPRPGKYYEVLAGQIVRFDELRYPLTQSLDITLWEYDYGSGDDHLGSFAIEKDTEPGTYVKTVTSASEASIYLIAYVVAEEEW